MNILVTAGNTLVPIDRVRCITNVFTGRTGTRIAWEADKRGHQVTLLTSHPEVVKEFGEDKPGWNRGWALCPYRTFENLQEGMARAIQEHRFDAVIHSAAVSDYLAGGIYAPAAGTRFHADRAGWESASSDPPRLRDVSAGKVKSDEPELWLRLVRAPKLVDHIREPWGFRGVLVKFKLEVGVSEEQLQDIAEQSRLHSAADLMAANTLEGASDWALIGPLGGRYERVSRRAMPALLLDAVEGLYWEKSHG